MQAVEVEGNDALQGQTVNVLQKRVYAEISRRRLSGRREWLFEIKPNALEKSLLSSIVEQRAAIGSGEGGGEELKIVEGGCRDSIRQIKEGYDRFTLRAVFSSRGALH